MSSYLDDLAARSLNLTSGIQPRLPGLFEPLQGTGGMDWKYSMNDMETPDSKPAANIQQISWLHHSPVDLAVESPSRDSAVSVSSDTLPPPRPKMAPPPEDPVQPSHPVESNLPAIQTSVQDEQESASPHETGLPGPISPPRVPVLPDRFSPQTDTLQTPPLSGHTPIISPAQLEESSGAIHSPTSQPPKQEGPDDRLLSSPERMEAKLIPESARAQVQVEPSRVRQRRSGTAMAPPKQTSARLDKIKRLVIPATSTEKHDPQPSLFESRTEIVESPIPSLMAAGSVTVRPSIKPARPAESGISQESASIPAQRAEAPPETIVNVTIGRIEVRAAPATQAKHETRAKPSTMGLDEYLKQFGSKR